MEAVPVARYPKYGNWWIENIVWDRRAERFLDILLVAALYEPPLQ
jgi:hypothetical protein